MSVLKDLNFLMLVFYLIGLAPLRYGATDINFKNRTYHVPVIVSSILNIVLVGFLLSSFNYFSSIGKINIILSIAALLSGMAINLSANFQCWLHSSTYQKFIHRIKKMEIVCEGMFSGNLPFPSFVNRYRLKVLLVFSFLTVSFTLTAIKFWYVFGKEGIMASILTNVRICFSALVVVHAILYIDLVQMFFRGMNLHIRNSPICFYSSSKIEFLKNIKLLHMDLWKLVMQINEFLSLSLLFIIINLMIGLVYDFYYVFRTLQYDWDALDTTGNLSKTLQRLYGDAT